MKGNEAYPEAKHGHTLPFLKTPFLKLKLLISHSTSKEQVLVAQGHTRRWKQACGMRRWTGYLQGKIATNSLTEQRTSDNPSVYSMLLHNNPKGVSYVQVLPRGYFKKQHTFMWSCVCLLYYLQSVRPMVPSRTSALETRAYIRLTQQTSTPRGFMFGLYFLRDQGVVRLTLRVLGLFKNNFIESLC